MDILTIAKHLIASLGVFAVFMAWEWFWPRRVLANGFRAKIMARLKRWPHNIGVMLADRVFFRLFVPFSSVSAATFAAEKDWGLFHAVSLPAWALFPACFLLMDVSNYVQHVAAHRIPWIWRMHRMHHTDTEFDVTTGVRTHPFESFMLAGIYGGVVLAFGMPPEAALAFHAYAGMVGKFCHSNIAMPKSVDAVLRLAMITPDQHRVHHSAWYKETDSNFGAVFPFWDRLFGTYTPQPIGGHDKMVIGLEDLRDARNQCLDRLLLLPFAEPTLPSNVRLTLAEDGSLVPAAEAGAE